MAPAQVTPQAWEAAALYVLELVGRPPAPIDSLHLALALGLNLSPTAFPTGALAGDDVFLSPKLSPRAIRWHCAHEIGHWTLRLMGLPDDEQGADAIAARLLIPLYAFDPDAAGWHVGELQRVHVHCSRETIARRILSLRPACMAVWVRGELVERLCSKWTPPDFEGPPTAFEEELAKETRRRRGIRRHGPRLIGFVDDSDRERVITLCEPSEILQKIDAPTPIARLVR